MLTCRSLLWNFVVALASLLAISSSALIGAEGNTAAYNVGDRVEFVSPFGEKKTGQIERLTGLDFVIVATDDGDSEIVDLDKLSRLTTQADNPFASAEEKADLAVMRTWEDSSGTFKIEAKMLRSEDDAVVLERKDGKQVTVPLKKLSDADRRFLSGDTSAGNRTVDITRTDLARARVVNLASTSKWQYTPDPAPDYDATVGETVGESTTVSPGQISALKGGNNNHIRFTLGTRLNVFENLARLLVGADEKTAYVITSSHDPSDSDAYQSRVFACDLVAGAVNGVGSFASGQLPFDMSPDGKWIIAHSSAFGFGKSNVASIYSLAGENADPIARWQPYNSGHGHDTDIGWMRFIDDGHVLIVSERGQPSLWSVPDLKPVWATENDRFTPHYSISPAISPGGKVVALCGNAGVGFVEVLSGRKLGQIEIDDMAPFDAHIAFDRAGRRLAMVERGRCRVWNLDPPELVRDFAIAQRIRAGSVNWVDDDRLLISGRYLVDVNLRIWLWDYEHDSATVHVRGNKVWAVVSQRPMEKWILGSSIVPHDAAIDIAAPLDPDELLVVRSGVAMAVEFDADFPEHLRDEVRDGITQNLQDSGFTVDPQSPIKLIGSFSVGPSQDITYENRFDFHNEREVTTHTVQSKTAQLTITYEGRPIWRYTNSKSAPHTLMTRDGESRDQALDREMQQDPTVLAHVRIPSRIPLGTADQPYGSASGVTEPPPLQTSAR